MAIYDFFLSRNGPVSSLQNYVGHTGRLFYDSSNGVIRLSDGVTPGGVPIPITVATDTITGGVKLGPGVTTNGQGQIVIDSTGLDFSFGDLASTIGTYTSNNDYAVLQTVNIDEDMVLASNGTGGINIVGQFHVHPTNGDLTALLEEQPIFSVKADGQVKILIPNVDSTEGAVSIVGSTTGLFLPPLNTGVMLHITGNYSESGIPSRVYNDSQNSFAAFVARRFNGTVGAPTAVLADQEIMRISGTAHNGTTIPGTGNQRIVYKALGNQTPSNQGGNIEFWATPLNSTIIAKVGTIDTANGITATKFTGPLTGNVTGSVSGKLIQSVRNAGTVAAGGTLIVDFTTDTIVYCEWSDGMTINYQNFLAGSTVKLFATKVTGGNDPINLDGVTAAKVSSGATITNNYTQGTTACIEFVCTGSTVSSVYVKL